MSRPRTPEQAARRAKKLVELDRADDERREKERARRDSIRDAARVVAKCAGAPHDGLLAEALEEFADTILEIAKGDME